MYGFDQNTQESSVTTLLKAGINENVTLQKVEYSSMSEGKDAVLQLTFSSSAGTLRSVFWPVDPNSVREPEGKVHRRDVPALGFVKDTPITRNDAVKIEFDNFNQRLKHIATKFVSEAEATIAANSYPDFCQKYVALLNRANLENTPLRLKVVLNNKDYPQLPKYPPFVESMEVPRDQTKLRITQYDKVVATDNDTAVVDAPTSFNFDDNDLI
jgi:hypothetical protein